MKRILVCIAVLVALCSGTFAANAVSKVNPKDGSVMITIPAGKFIMGSNDGSPNEKPAHKVYLDSYQIGKYEVTVAQYRKFCKATGREMPTAPYWGWKDNHPVVNATWFDAAAYCKWAGGRLPTEAEWEKAARGTDGRRYPWGNTWDKNKCANRELGLSSTAPVGSYPAGASPYGCMDMVGNAWEWCQDWFKSYPGNSNPVDDTNRFRVLRGGGWSLDDSSIDRCAYREGYGPGHYNVDCGFRLAR